MGNPIAAHQSYVLELEGRMAGRLQSFESGNTEPVLTNSKGLTPLEKLNPGPMRLKFGTGMSDEFYRWIRGLTERAVARRSGSILTIGSGNKAQARLSFANALVTGLGIPELDTSVKTGYLSVDLVPESIWYSAGPDAATPGIHAASQGPFNTSSFSITIDGLEKECRQVSRIQQLRLAAKTKGYVTGDRAVEQIEPLGTSFPSVVLRVPLAGAKGFMDWFDAAASKAGGSSSGKNGLLSLAPASGSAGPKLKLYDLFPAKVSHSAGWAEVELSCDSMSLSAGYN